jgi:hypothetical protein
VLTHGERGAVEEIRTYLYGKTEQRDLLEYTERLLSEERREQLSDLVRARGSIPDDILEKIARSATAGRTPTQIAERMNELEVIDGMGGKYWTAAKIKNALLRYYSEREAV